MAETLRYYLDEDVSFGPTIARDLRHRGIDVISAHEAGRAGTGIRDADQLRYAGSRRRVMVTEDLRFVPEPPHGGLLVVQKPLSIGEYIAYLELVAHVYAPEDMRNLVRYYDL